MAIATQNWDGVTAPAQPSGWNYSSASLITTSSLSAGISPTSNPNVLELAATATNASSFATYATADGNGGNVAAQANFAVTSFGHTCSGGLIVRASTAAIVQNSSTFYWAILDLFNAQVTLCAVVAGSLTTLATVGTSSLAAGMWYGMALACSGTAISVTVQRLSDSTWMNQSGTFQPSVANAITVTDSSITGSGYSGLSLAAKIDTAYTDEWALSGAVCLTPVTAILRPLHRPLSQAIVSGMYD
jgi:hypothetical protein